MRCWVGRAAWVYIQKVNKISGTLLDNWGNGGTNSTRTVPFKKLAGVMTAAQVEKQWDASLLVELANKTGFTLLLAPTDEATAAAHVATSIPDARSDGLRTDMEIIRTTVRSGKQVVSAPQFFPTPPGLAVHMVDLAGLAIGMRA